jgi:hypothetical protein
VEIKGAAFLYTLATLAITFAGFAALLLILRQLAGGALNALDRFLARTVISHCVWFAFGALAPPLLALFDFPERVIWKAAALLFGVPMLAFLLTYRHRRIVVTGHAPPKIVTVVMVGFGALSLLAMIVSVWLGIAPAGAYAAALVFNFGTLALSFIVALDVILRERSINRDKTG